MKNIYVIIVTYKGMRWYDKCLGSLRESTIPLQTIVVDNTPGDEDAEYIKTHYPEVHIIKTNENLGFGRANNMGMRYALDNGCDYVFLLNQDTWIEKDSIAKLVEMADKHPEYGIVSPMQIAANKKHLQFLLDDGNHNYELLSDLYFHQTKEMYPVKYVNAAAWLLPRKTLENIGGFCPIIFQYGEDDDYLHRVLYHGYKVGIVPASQIVHDCGVRLGESDVYAKRANWDDIDTLLDINNNQSISSIRRHFAWKRIISWLHRNKRQYEYYSHRYQTVREKQKQIEECRAAHKIKQANWL